MRLILIALMQIVFVLPVFAASGEISVISWNLKQMGQKHMNIEGVASQMMGADIIALQEMNIGDSGKNVLNNIATRLAKLTSEKICKGWTDVPTGSRERYAYLWKNKSISYVKTDGGVIENCPDTAIFIPLASVNADKILREPAYGVFYVKDVKRKFVLASVHLLPESKKPAHEVGPLFEIFQDEALPIILAGDFNLEERKPVFKQAMDMNFEPALVGVKTTLKKNKKDFSRGFDNLWYRGVTLQFAKVINLFQAFPDSEAEVINKTISDHSPILGRFSFATAVQPTQVSGQNAGGAE